MIIVVILSAYNDHYHFGLIDCLLFASHHDKLKLKSFNWSLGYIFECKTYLTLLNNEHEILIRSEPNRNQPLRRVELAFRISICLYRWSLYQQRVLHSEANLPHVYCLRPNLRWHVVVGEAIGSSQWWPICWGVPLGAIVLVSWVGERNAAVFVFIVSPCKAGHFVRWRGKKFVKKWY